MNVACLCATALVLTTGFAALAQEKPKTPTRLSELIEEAQKNNAQVVASEHARRAATHVAQQVTTLPDPQFTVQQFSVGSPRPFAGFTNSDFAYIGFGASQQVPYPGKLRLKGQVAEREVGVQQAQTDELRALIAEQVKTSYFHLAYLSQTLQVLEATGATLKQVADAELSRYRAGQGSQADVLKAQLEQTKLLREITMHHAEMAQYQAELKQLLHHPQGSVDIVPEDLRPTALAYGASELLSFVQGHNPAVQSEKAALSKEGARLRSAERGRKPDFNVGYMFEETGTHYRDYYMLTLSLNLPRRRRVDAEVAEAAEMLEKEKASLDSQLQQQLSEVQKQYIAASSTAELLTEYRDGLIPQAQSVMRANLAAYQSAAGELSSVLLAVGDVLNLQRDSAQALLDHELAIAHLETLTGARLR
ncbi:MAG: TolC family protein [Acidobacteriota bacterium]|nr:TolC family protein [Acidobacteriota bacterium]